MVVDIIEGYRALIASLPQPFGGFLNIFLFSILILSYYIFVWKFHKVIGTKNILKIDLKEKDNDSFGKKFEASFLYFVKYIVIVPLLIFFWFAILTIFLILFTNTLEAQQIITIAAIVVASVRLSAYIPNYGETIAREIAKLLPITLLIISLLNPNLLDFNRITTQISQITGSFTLILSYLIFIIVLEILLRFFEFFLDLLGLGEDGEEKED